jgi:hypothetical protein
VTEELVAVIEPNGVSAQEPAHSRHQVRLGRFHHQMKVISHQAIGMHLETRLLTGLGQRLEDVLPIDVIPENVRPPIPTAPAACLAVARSQPDSPNCGKTTV